MDNSEQKSESQIDTSGGANQIDSSNSTNKGADAVQQNFTDE